MSLLGFLLRHSWKAASLSVLAGVAGGLGGVVLIALIQTRLSAGSNASPASLAWAFGALVALAAGMRALAQAAMIRLAQRSVSTLAIRLCESLLALPLRRFEAIDPGGLLAVLTEDVLIVAEALIGIPLLCINVPIVVACVLYLGWLSPAVLACGIVLAVPAIVGSQAFVAGRGIRRLRAARAGQDALVGQFRSLIEGFRELKQHRARRSAFLDEALKPTAAAVREDTAAGLSAFAAAGSFGQFAYFGFLGFILFVLPAFHDPGREALGGATLAVLFLMAPLDLVLSCLPMIARARASLGKIHAALPSAANLVEDESPTAGLVPPATVDSVALDGVTFAYDALAGDEPFVLGPIDLELRSGEVTFLVGGNGGGKTTLVKLLAGLYTPGSGTIRRDGREVDPVDAEAYRQLFTVLFADGHLFPSLLGLEGKGLDARASSWLERLGLADKLTVEGGKFSTTNLSVGQRRRLALVAALLEDRPVCVFDEWAAHQDPHFRALFYCELLPELKARGKAVLVISHDEGYFGIGSRVLKLQDGLICEASPTTNPQRTVARPRPEPVRIQASHP